MTSTPTTTAPPGRPSPLALAGGVVLVTGATALALGVEHLPGQVNASTVAVALGAVAVNVGLVRGGGQQVSRFAGRRLLRVAVVLLGLKLSLGQLQQLGVAGAVVVAITVTATFLGTQALGRLLGVSRPRALLVATGFSICGASAVAAMEPVAGGDEDDTAVAIALVTLCGTLAIILLPLLRGPLGLDPQLFGSWVGASVHDVGQTVATANRVPGALEAAVVVKLSRVLLLAPLVALVGLRVRRSAAAGAAAEGQSVGPARRAAVVPLFVVGFIVAVLVSSTGVLPASVLDVAGTVQKVLLVAALFGLGTGIRLSLLRRTGARALALGATSWLLVAVVAYAGVRLTGA